MDAFTLRELVSMRLAEAGLDHETQFRNNVVEVRTNHGRFTVHAKDGRLRVEAISGMPAPLMAARRLLEV